MTRSGTAKWEIAQATFPSTADDSDGWARALEDEPGVLHRILSDIVKVARATDGEKRTGRRPVVGMGLEQLFELLFPEPADDEFVVAFTRLLGATSQRAFASRVPCNQATLSRLLKGEWQPDLVMLERIAAAGGVPPSYFREWRALKLGQMVARTYLTAPHLSSPILKELARRSE